MDTNLSDTNNKKRKSISILLAIFLGPFTWLYTYKKDAWKASLGLGLTLSVIVVGVALVIAHRMLQATNPEDIYEGYEIIGWIILSFPILVGTWLWAVIDTASKKADWFKIGPAKQSKKTAVLLAIFVGPWTWLYTYSYDAWKFWLGIAVGYGFLLCFAITDATYFIAIWFAGSLTIWTFSIIESATRDNDYYKKLGSDT